MADVAKIIARIQQLRAISKSTHSKAEAETTAAIAAKLIAEYQLSEAILETETGKNDDPLDVENEHIIYETGKAVPWKAQLVWNLANLNGLFAYKTRIMSRRSTRFRIIGRKSAIEITKYMFGYLVDMIEQLVDANVPKGAQRGVNPERDSYALGCVNGFYYKMAAARKTVMEQVTSAAMVLISNKQEEAKSAFIVKNPEFKFSTAPASKAHITSSYYDGFRKGQTLSVNAALSGVDSTSAKKIK